ncbi:MAG: hypothetical protein BEN19_08285 [Epulopiscium sp. Nuni2H_MBin003]|nr:MAG: hypothetical protein BEN19_08285 [Epulopiscium sp. Nuni2H_MBin003]
MNYDNIIYEKIVDYFGVATDTKYLQNLVELLDNQYSKEDILDLLIRNFHMQYKTCFQQNYSNNLENILQNTYSKISTGTPLSLHSDISEYSLVVLRISETDFFIYNKVSEEFIGPVTTKYDVDDRPYYFKDLSNELFYENIIRVGDLTYLMDHVRHSSLYGADNHVYLYYDTPDLLCALLQLCDLSEIIRSDKFIFLLGTENKKLYPINFLDEYGVDYSETKTELVGIDEFKSITLWCPHNPHCGTSFFYNICNQNEYISYLLKPVVNSMPKVGHASKLEISTLEKHKWPLIENSIETNKTYTLSEVRYCLYKTNYYIMGKYKYKAFETMFFVITQYKLTLSIEEIFKACLLSEVYLDAKSNQRTIPNIIVDNHCRNELYLLLVKFFRYYKILTPERHFITRTASNINHFLIVAPQRYDPLDYYLCCLNYYHIGPFPLEKYAFYAIRLEDGKLMPEQTFRAVCKFLDVPYSNDMLNDIPNANTLSSSGTLSLFDKTPLTRDVSSVLSEFDIFRLNIIYKSRLIHFGYDYMDDTHQPIPLDVFKEMLKVPFLFEHKIPEEYRAQVRQNIYESMCDVAERIYAGNMPFARLIKPLLE